MPAIKPPKNCICFIVHTVGDRKSTWSKPLLHCVLAEDCVRKIVEAAPGMKGRLEIAKYDDGKFVTSYSVEGEDETRNGLQGG